MFQVILGKQLARQGAFDGGLNGVFRERLVRGLADLVHQTPLLPGIRYIVLGVVGEESGAVERRVGFRKVHPTLALEVIRGVAVEPQTHDVGGAVEGSGRFLPEGAPLGGVVPDHRQKVVQSESRDQPIVTLTAAVVEEYLLVCQVDSHNLLAIVQFVAREGLGDQTPYGTRSPVLWEPEGGIGAPPHVIRIGQDVAQYLLHAHNGHPLSHPVGAHLVRREGPHLVVVRPHKHLRKTLTKYGIDPLSERRPPALRFLRLLGPDEALEAAELGFAREAAYVVLERIRYHRPVTPHPRLAHVAVPFGHGPVQDVVEVLVVREDDVAPDVPGEALLVHEGSRQTPGGVTHLVEVPVGVTELMKTGGRAQPCRPGSKDDNSSHRTLVRKSHYMDVARSHRRFQF